MLKYRKNLKHTCNFSLCIFLYSFISANLKRLLQINQTIHHELLYYRFCNNLQTCRIINFSNSIARNAHGQSATPNCQVPVQQSLTTIAMLIIFWLCCGQPSMIIKQRFHWNVLYSRQFIYWIQNINDSLREFYKLIILNQQSNTSRFSLCLVI